MERYVGGCLCGKVRFAVTGAPQSVYYCHCFSCRRQGGAVVAVWAKFPVEGHFSWTGEVPTAFHSSPGVTRRFCPACGTPISYESRNQPDLIDLHIGTFDSPDRLVPERHWFMSEKVAWFETADGLPRHMDG